MSEKPNTIEKQRTGLRVLGILALVFGLGAVAGGVVMTIFGATNLVASNIVAGVLLLVFGIIVALCGVAGAIFGIWAIWMSTATKATKGSIAEDNVAKAGTVNGKKCPKCGVTNTGDATECQVCHTPLE